MRVSDVIQRLLPQGTESGALSHHRCPRWPPDLFAVAATLVTESGCYSSARYTGGLSPTEACFDARYMSQVDSAGRKWSSGHFPDLVQTLWERLLASGPCIVGLRDRADWWDDAMKLLAISDVASVGFGFGEAHPDLSLARWVFEQILRSEVAAGASQIRVGANRVRLPYLPKSLCIAVPPSEVCVQPKTRTPQVGCTVRALSHNLALLPNTGEVKTHWRYAAPWGKGMAEDEPYNILLIPFPYAVVGQCFKSRESTVVTNRRAENRGDRVRNVSFFSIDQLWLDGDDVSDRLSRFICELTKNASRYVQKVHGIVLPEMALRDGMAQTIAQTVAAETGIELFISGVASTNPKNGLKQNRTYCEIFANGHHHASWHQSKHHRWKLDERQVKQYNLGHALRGAETWWEEIDVVDRECSFHVFREGASLVVLVCEDLARVDPVQSVVRAVGPNLVITLLMDGPQLERRWPGRYATVLADDPGSAVLTLTSMGLMRRLDGTSNQIALWKDPKGGAREILLPDGCHGVALSLTPGFEENFCSDWRSDSRASMTLTLSEIFAVRADHSDTAWLNAR